MSYIDSLPFSVVRSVQKQERSKKMKKMPHIQLDAGIGAVSAILPGDPARVDAIASFLSDVRFHAFNREYKSITGTYQGVRILAVSTGMGGASAAICLEELANIGIQNIVRIGSCGALQDSLSTGDLVLCDRAVCDDGASRSYAGIMGYPMTDGGGKYTLYTKTDDGGKYAFYTEADAIFYTHADPQLLRACQLAADRLQITHQTGATRCHDALYLGQKPLLDEFYSGKGVLASDMETAALFAVGSVRGIRTASILNVVVEWKKNIADGISSYKDGALASAEGEKNTVRTALEALVYLEKHGSSLCPEP